MPAPKSTGASTPARCKSENLTDARSNWRPRGVPTSPATVLKRVRNRVRASGLFKYQVQYVDWRYGVDADGDDAMFVHVGVRPRNGVVDIPAEEIVLICDEVLEVMRRAKLVDRFVYLQPEDA